MTKRGASRFRVQKLLGLTWFSQRNIQHVVGTRSRRGSASDVLTHPAERLRGGVAARAGFCGAIWTPGASEGGRLLRWRCGCSGSWIRSHLKRFHGCQLQRLDPPKPLKEAESSSSGWERSWWKLGLWRVVEDPRRCPGHHGAARACLDHSRRCPRPVSES